MDAPFSFDRRALLRGATRCGLGLGALGALSKLQSLAALSSAGSGYKALVCIYLYGGNDAFNLIVPMGAGGYSTYAAARLALAIPQPQLLPIQPANPQGELWGLHPTCAPIQSLFEAGRLAIISNVGTLIEPATKLQIYAGTARVPAQLFSHNDQTAQWMAASQQLQNTTGWGGRISDAVANLNAPGAIAEAISLSGNNLFQLGQNTLPYAINPEGPIELAGFWGDEGVRRRAAFDAILNKAQNHVLEQALADINKRSIANEATVRAAFEAAPSFLTPFPNSWLGGQLLAVAKLIASHATLGLSRQVFFVATGGFDTHDEQDVVQPALFADLAACLAAFDAAMLQIGESQDVCAFTASDFGRTMSTNGRGTDHGWGSHHIVTGGAVLGRELYGTMPDLTLEGDDDLGGGRYVPTTSIEQFGAPLATWFGVAPGDLATVFPNLANFPAGPLTFMS